MKKTVTKRLFQFVIFSMMLFVWALAEQRDVLDWSAPFGAFSRIGGFMLGAYLLTGLLLLVVFGLRAIYKKIKSS